MPDHGHAGLLPRLISHKHFYVLILPAVTLFVVMNYVPMAGIVIAFKRYTISGGLFGSPWVGLKYFREVLRDPSFFQIVRNTFVISFVKLLVVFPAPIIFALILNEILWMPAKKGFQTISYLPHFISWVVAAGLVRNFLGLNGPVNYLVTLAGGEPIVWLARPTLFIPILVISAIWKGIGWGSIVYLAAITSVDPQMYEAAAIDGAGRVRRAISLTVPSIMPVIVVMFIIRVGNVTSAGFDQILNLYNPLVYSVGDIIDTFVYRVGIVGGQYSYTAAIGLAKNLVGLTLLAVTNIVVSRTGGRESAL